MQESALLGEAFLAFLDDVYAVSHQSRAVYNLWAEELHKHAWDSVERWQNPHVEQMSGTRKSWAISSDLFVEAVTEERPKEGKLWEASPWVPDLQCAWFQCAELHCHHFLRTVPPSQSAQYAAWHDMGMRRAMGTVCKGTAEQTAWADHLATLPMRPDGLGQRSAAAPAFRASWADAPCSHFGCQS